MKLIQGYVALVESTGRGIDDEERIYSVNAHTEKKTVAKVTLDGRTLPLRIPTKKVRKEREQDAYVGFHPLSESHIRGESVVAAWLRRTICQSLTEKAIPLVIELLEASLSDGVKSSADPDLLPLLSAVKGADDTTLNNITKAIKRVDNEKYTLCNIYTKRDGKIIEDGKEVTYDRACIVRFPIPMDNPKSLFGVTMRTGKVKDLLIMNDLLNVVIPGWDTDAYCSGSNANEAPYFRALITSYYKVATAINKCAESYKDILDDADEYRTDTSWAHLIDESYDEYIAEIPAMVGNIGSQGGKESGVRSDRHVSLPEVQVSANETPAPAPQQAAPSQSTVNPAIPQQHVQQTQHAPVPQPKPQSSGGLTFADVQRMTNTSSTPAPQQGAFGHTAPVHQPQQQPTIVGYDAAGQPIYNAPPQQNMQAQQPTIVGYDAAGQPIYSAPPQQPMHQPQQGGFAPTQNSYHAAQNSYQTAQNGYQSVQPQRTLSARELAESGYQNPPTNSNGYW